jgi:hypothetical protein
MRKRSIFLSLITLILCGMPQLASQALKGQVFETKTLSPLSASGNKKGDRFTLQVLQPDNYKGAMIEGEIANAKAAGRVSGKSELLFRFDKLTLASGQVIPITADLQSVRNSQGNENVDEEGHVIGKSSIKKDVATTAAISGVGALIGGLAGGKKGAAQGAAVGAAVGMTITFSTRGPDIKFAPGAVFILSVSEAPSK